jgi:glycosyltransferase involved in cell wall biosynthesis
MHKDTLLILIAPNVSEQMGGEAIKALQMFQELRKLHPNTCQITHGRNRSEVSRLGLRDVQFVDDTRLSIALWKSVLFRPLLDVWFSIKAVRLAEVIAKERGMPAIVHQTEPNSPVSPRALAKRHVNVFGPINGNIYYPESFRGNETRWNRLRRVLHMPLQSLNSCLPRGLKNADQILVAGGERTELSLRQGGCPSEILVDSLDCGIRDTLLDRPRVKHEGVNLRFIHFGRLVFHKGTALVIESLSKTSQSICLDIVGQGPELATCRALVEKLGLEKRVRFLGWYTAQEELFDSFSDYRGVVLPSIEDANGIVIQEAMALGLPPICLDWGGPSLLIEDGQSGYLVRAGDRSQIVADIGTCMERLSQDGALAEAMSIRARAAAQNWRWSVLTSRWLAMYPSAGREKPQQKVA